MTIDDAELKLAAAEEHFHENMKKLRTGRANSSMLDAVMVDVYGAKTPLAHVATIKVVDAQLIQVSPFDPGNLDAITASLRDDIALGLNPADDGKIIRLPIPAMTQERRTEVVKQLKEKLEEANVAMRQSRHDFLNAIKAQKNDGDISEDEQRSLEKQMDELMRTYKGKLEDAEKLKEKEIMSV